MIWISVWLRRIAEFLKQNLPEIWAETLLYVLEFGFLMVVLFVMDFVIRSLLLPIIKAVVLRTKLNWDEVFYYNKVYRSLLHLIPLSIAFNLLNNLFIFHEFGYVWAEKVLYFLTIAVFIQLIFRIVNAFLEISKDDNNYTTIGIRTFGQLIKVFSIFFAVLILIALLFNISFGQISTVLGALTALIILIFRDTILGFVSGVQISTTRMVKIGDWIEVSKYNVEGVVLEINLTTVKIEKFDKTLAMVPTYDLISSQIVNNMAMVRSESRRVKRSIYFKINSFRFLDMEALKPFEEMPLLQKHIAKKKQELESYALGGKNKIRPKRQLTNIGLFRKYTEMYLKYHPGIDASDVLMVRQLESNPNGLPLEIYCFTNTAEWLKFESIQSDIFDHLLTASKDFDLEVAQTLTS